MYSESYQGIGTGDTARRMWSQMSVQAVSLTTASCGQPPPLGWGGPFRSASGRFGRMGNVQGASWDRHLGDDLRRVRLGRYSPATSRARRKRGWAVRKPLWWMSLSNSGLSRSMRLSFLARIRSPMVPVPGKSYSSATADGISTFIPSDAMVPPQHNIGTHELLTHSSATPCSEPCAQGRTSTGRPASSSPLPELAIGSITRQLTLRAR